MASDSYTTDSKVNGKKIGGIIGIVCYILLAIIAIIGVITLFVLPGVVEDKINEGISDSLVMTKDNVDSWGTIPGKSGTVLVKEMTFFNYLNPEDLFSTNPAKKPQFQLVKPVPLQQFSNSSKVELLDSGKEISYTQTASVKLLGTDTSLLAQPIKIPNIFGFGVWDYSQGVNLTQKIMKGVGTLTLSLIEDDVVHFGVLTDALEHSTFQNLTFDDVFSDYFNPASILKEKAQLIWDDQLYGWSNLNGRMYWIQAVERGTDSPIYKTLALHFALTRLQMIKLTTQKFRTAVNLVQKIAVDLYDCPNSYCDNMYILNSQMANQEFTLNIPDGQGGPVNSLLDVNKTGFGFLEISYYKTGKFLDQFNLTQNANYNGTSIDVTRDQVSKWLAVKTTGRGGVAQTETTLLHPTNLDLLVRCGLEFEEKGNEDIFKTVVTRFGFNDQFQARMIYQWMKYLAEEFVTLEKTKYFETSVQTVFFSKFVSRIYRTLQSQLKPFMMIEIMLDETQKSSFSCSQILLETVDNSVAINTYCGGTTGDLSKDQVTEIYTYCKTGSPTSFTSTQLSQAGITYQQSLYMCTLAPNSIGTIAYYQVQAEKQIYDKYSGCQVQGSCSAEELISMQWFNSTITDNPLPVIEKIHKKGDSMITWFPRMTTFQVPFEINVLSPSFVAPQTLNAASSILFYQKLFAPAVVSKAIIESVELKNNTFVNEVFGQTDAQPLLAYLRAFVSNNVFGGNSVSLATGQIMLNYTSPLLAEVISGNPLVAGDPTAQSFQPLQMPISQTMFKRKTGKSDIKMSNKIIQNNGNSFLSTQMLVFDGNKTTTQFISPWDKQINITGRDTVFESGVTKNSKLELFIPDFARNLELKFVKKFSKDIESFRFELDTSNLSTNKTQPGNDQFNQLLYNGLMNLTTIKKAPVVISKVYLNGVDKELSSEVDMLDSDGKPVVYNDETDNFYVDVEHYTGAPVKVNYAFQINLLVKKRDLYNNEKTVILPVVVVKAKTTVSDKTKKQMKELYSAVEDADNLQTYLLYFVIFLGVLLMILTIVIGVLIYMWVKGKGNDSEDEFNRVQDSNYKGQNTTNVNMNTKKSGEDLEDTFLMEKEDSSALPRR